MEFNTGKRRRAAILAMAALGLVGTVGAGVTGDASAWNATEKGLDDTRVPSEPYELGGTSETYLDMWKDGSYYDPSLGERVSPTTTWPYQTGTLAGTSETYVDLRDDGSYYDPSLGRRVSPAG
jgi:hypothetical protein